MKPSEGTRYFGVYAKLEDIGEQEADKLSRSITTLGSYVTVTISHDDNGEPHAELSTKRAGRLGALPAHIARQLDELSSQGWKCVASLSYIWFDNNDKTYGAEAAVVAYAPSVAKPVEAYLTNLFNRIGKGEHPTPKLSDKDLTEVVATNGAWNGAKKVEPPKFKQGSGVVPYRTRREFTDSVNEAAAEGRMGCKVATALIYIALGLVVLFIILHVTGVL